MKYITPLKHLNDSPLAVNSPCSTESEKDLNPNPEEIAKPFIFIHSLPVAHLISHQYEIPIFQSAIDSEVFLPSTMGPLGEKSVKNLLQKIKHSLKLNPKQFRMSQES